MTPTTDAGGASARTPSDPAADARRLRAENRLLLESIRHDQLRAVATRQERRTRLLESLSLDWVTPYAEILDLQRRTGDPILTGPASFWQRRKGQNWPVYQTEQQLAILRAPARLLVATNSYAQGLIEGLTSYVIGPGYTYRAAKREKESDLPDGVVRAAQRVIDAILARWEWYGGEEPGLEEELFGRSVEDGEFAVRTYPLEDGWTDVRTVEPEQITAPPPDALGEGEDGNFGVVTPTDDVQLKLWYWVQYGDGPADGERVEAADLTHFRRNVRRSMKRGIPDFSFDAYDSLSLAGHLRTNLGEAASQQASIVGVRQHDSGDRDAISAFVADDADLTRSDYLTGRQEQVRLRRSGTWEDVPKGMNYIPGPGANNAPNHLQILEACLLSAGVKWNAPKWLATASSSEINYASSVTAESPFVRTVVRRQRGYKEAFRRIVAAAFWHYLETRGLAFQGRTYTADELRREIDLVVEAASPEVRNKTEEAQRAQIEIPLGVDSPQQYMQRQGRDPDQVEADNRKWADDHGPTGGGMGLPGDPEDDPDPDPAGGGLTESLLESLGLEWHTEAGYRGLLESGRAGLVRKAITTSKGTRTHVWVRAGTPGGGADRAGHEAKVAAAVAAVRAAAADPAKVTHAHLQELAGHLDYITRDTAAELARGMALKVGGRKAELAKRVVDDIRGKKAAHDKATAPGQVRQVATAELAVDPKRFQFKLNTSNPAGVTDELKTVTEWNPDFAGVVAVWKDPDDGKTYVVNGHHRHELATRLGAGELAVRYIDAKDAKEARAKGALINIAEGRGTAIDAAKFMRDTGVTVDDFAKRGVALKAGALAEQATALAGLSDKAFDRLARGDLDAGKAIAVARHLKDHDRQDKLFGLLSKREGEGKDLGPKTIEEMARMMAAAPSVTRTENTLWGPEETTEDTFVQRAALSAGVRADLSKEIGDFAALASKRRAGRTAGAGNVLNVDENRRIADEAERAKNLYDQLANRKGPIADALNAGSVKLAAAKSEPERKRAHAETVEAVRTAIRSEFDKLNGKAQ